MAPVTLEQTRAAKGAALRHFERLDSMVGLGVMSGTKEGRIEADPKVIGERPCGSTPLDAPIVQAVAGVVKAFGMTPRYAISSTDANIPMSLGIPAVTIGRGGPGGRSHAPDEWTNVDPKINVANERIALAMILAVAGGLE